MANVELLSGKRKSAAKGVKLLQRAQSPTDPRPTLQFNVRALLIAALLLGMEVCIATVFRHVAWVRGFLGDLLAVVFVYYLLKSVIRAPPWKLAVTALLVGYALEACQYLTRAAHLVIHNRLLRILVGSTPDLWDMLAYTLGFVLILAIESRTRSKAAP
jgi:Protein of unknown function (DUF2809)